MLRSAFFFASGLAAGLAFTGEAYAIGIVNGNFEGAAFSPPWTDDVPAGALDDAPKRVKFGGGGNHILHIGDWPPLGAPANPEGVADAHVWQEFNCAPGGVVDRDKWCTITFDELFLQRAGGGEVAYIVLANNRPADVGKRIGGRPAAGGFVTRKLSIRGCMNQVGVFFGVDDRPGDPAGIKSSLHIDNLSCSCTATDETDPQLYDDEDVPTVRIEQMPPNDEDDPDDDVEDEGDILGACCLLDGSCELRTETTCQSAGGTFDEEGACATGECDPIATDATTWGRVKSRYR